MQTSIKQPKATDLYSPQEDLPILSIITPAYNEESIVTENLQILCDYLERFKNRYRWEIVIINDGSKDKTGLLADAFAAEHPDVRVYHHQVNRNIGGALRTGFLKARGEFLIVMDLDLTYAPEHIEQIVKELEVSEAEVVIASPYMKGGKCTNVPIHRLLLSKVVNYLMRLTASANIFTFTGMVRGYRKEFLQSLNLKSNTYSINPEIIQKALILRARIVEIPAHLDWSNQQQTGGRSSSIRIFKGVLAGLMSSFILRPYAFFMLIGLILMLLSAWTIGWIIVHTAGVFDIVEVPSGLINDRFTEAVAHVFRERPHAFFAGGITLVLAIQFFSLGFLSLQSKRYFDELFHLGTSNLKKWNENDSSVKSNSNVTNTTNRTDIH